MKPHHLDAIIHKLTKYLDGDEVDISLPEMLLIAFQEIKSIDQSLSHLSDWVHETGDYD